MAKYTSTRCAIAHSLMELRSAIRVTVEVRDINWNVAATSHSSNMSAKHHNGTQSGTVTDDSMQQLLDDVFEFNNSGKGLAVTKIRGHLVHHLYELQQNYFILSCLYCAAKVAIVLDSSFDSVLWRDKLT